MPEVTVITPNVPTWVDLNSKDLQASIKFYAALFGWTANKVAGPEGGNYTYFELRGKHVAGLGDAMSPDQHPAWTLYMASTNADQTVAKMTAAGGNVVMPPMDVMTAGRMAIVQDAGGAAVGVWQAGEHKGAEITQEPSSMMWTELQTRDMPATVPFYQKAFGWDTKVSPMGAAMNDYTEWQILGESVAGGMAMSKNVPANVPSFWLTYFGVENVSDSIAKVKQLGGQVMMGPDTYPNGQFAVCADSAGATFGIMDRT